MANRGRIYPRAFGRDLGWRDNANRWQYLAKRIMVRLSGPQVAAMGWPLTMMQSEDAVANYDEGWMMWDFGKRSTIYPNSTFQVFWRLTFTEQFWSPDWMLYVSPTLYRYNRTRLELQFPMAWAGAMPFHWRKPDGSGDPLISTGEQRAAVWADY